MKFYSSLRVIVGFDGAAKCSGRGFPTPCSVKFSTKISKYWYSIAFENTDKNYNIMPRQFTAESQGLLVFSFCRNLEILPLIVNLIQQSIMDRRWHELVQCDQATRGLEQNCCF